MWCATQWVPGSECYPPGQLIGAGGALATAPGALRYKGDAHKQLPTYDVARRARGLAGGFCLAN